MSTAKLRNDDKYMSEPVGRIIAEGIWMRNLEIKSLKSHKVINRVTTEPKLNLRET